MGNRIQRSRRGPPRRGGTWWVDLALEQSAVDSGAGVIRVVTLFQPIDEDEKVTILRIVGSVFVGVQAAQGTVTSVNWGVYTAPTGTTSLLLNPASSSNVSSENWLHWRSVYTSRSDVDSSDISGYLASKVDIKVKRKLDPTTLLQWSCSAGVAFSSAVSLRGLMMQSAS